MVIFPVEGPEVNSCECRLVAHPKNGDLVEIIHHLGVIVGHIIPENFLDVLEVGRELLLLLILGKVEFHTVIN